MKKTQKANSQIRKHISNLVFVWDFFPFSFSTSTLVTKNGTGKDDQRKALKQATFLDQPQPQDPTLPFTPALNVAPWH